MILIQRPLDQANKKLGIEKPMHYKNGRPAKNGDIVLSLMNQQQPVVGVLFGAKAEAGSDCNGMIASVTPSATYPQCADLKNCLHIDDIAAADIPNTAAPENCLAGSGTENETVPDKA